ncbi:MAG: sigma-70 family RNA polymerase sigma factor [Bacteroidia bacterium]|nr:sigma-70 family RNA polymerase sigma factor [Bacteroidia bacterium]
MQSYGLSDKQLVHLYAKGSEKALEVLLHRHKRKLFSYINTMVKDRQKAEDLFQDTFIKVIDQIKSGRYKEQERFLPWLYRIAHNLVIDTLRKDKKMIMERANDHYNPLDHIQAIDTSIEDKINQTGNSYLLKMLIKQLPDNQQEVLIMRHYSDMSFKEIADVTNVSINTALGRMRYALINLRKLMEDHRLNMVA